MARCFLLSFKGRQGGWPKIHRVTKCQQYDGLQQLEVEILETFWVIVRPYSPSSSSCPAGPCWRWGGAKKRQASWAPVWIGVRWLDWRPESASSPLAHLQPWRISTMHGAMEGGGGVIAKDEPLEEELDILEHPFAANQTLLLVLSIKGRGQPYIAMLWKNHGWTFHKDITFSPLCQ